MAQCLAEELDVPFESVDMVMGDTELCPFDYGTVGSMTSPLFTPAVRKRGRYCCRWRPSNCGFRGPGSW